MLMDRETWRLSDHHQLKVRTELGTHWLHWFCCYCDCCINETSVTKNRCAKRMWMDFFIKINCWWWWWLLWWRFQLVKSGKNVWKENFSPVFPSLTDFFIGLEGLLLVLTWAVWEAKQRKNDWMKKQRGKPTRRLRDSCRKKDKLIKLHTDSYCWVRSLSVCLWL